MSNLFSVSRKFEDFVNDVLDEEVSELDELSDDDNTDVDPDYSAETLNEEEDSEEESSSNTSNRSTDVGECSSHQQSINRLFWKKTMDFSPMPPAPDHQQPPLNAMNLAPKDYVSKYLTEDIFVNLTDFTNKRYHTITVQT